ncbi:hypothetical protein K504DRAFT_535755 [Pleomassaria siparia CBS 279.74]|uniref:ABM domain-containing protein n=1 Tax=Pleomassaria siparia CBS 279.74 TaxID=1314801 RepID=A0A6G1K3B0_9PLEO|nr:hypothetical protein K504DRAFT_535755 [Pleomassaria siparia CBS 279.74]
MTYTGPSISLHVHITIDPSNVEKFLEALKPGYEGVIAEPENTYFEVFHNPENPGEFKFVENWNGTKEWFMNVQMKKPYYEPYLAITEPMFIKERTFEIWGRMPGKEWVSVKETN